MINNDWWAGEADSEKYRPNNDLPNQYIIGLDWAVFYVRANTV